MKGRAATSLAAAAERHDDHLDRNEIGDDLDGGSMLRIAAIEPVAVNPEHAAKLIGVSRSTFYKLVESGRIGPLGVRLGKHVRYPLAELREWAEAGMPPRHEWVARRRLEQEVN